MTDNFELTKQPADSAFSVQNFEHAQRIAKMISTSSLIPHPYQGKVENVMIAMEMANRMNISPLMVMQNLHIVKGNPGWSGAFVIAIINGSKRFDEPLDFEFSGEGDDYGCICFTTRKGKRVEGDKVTWKMVKGEGWLNKDGSKWKTMPGQMFRYRSAAFFGRANAPDLTMGMQTAEEIIDVTYSEARPKPPTSEQKEQERIKLMIKDAKDLKALGKLEKQCQGNDELMELYVERESELLPDKMT